MALNRPTFQAGTYHEGRKNIYQGVNEMYIPSATRLSPKAPYKPDRNPWTLTNPIRPNFSPHQAGVALASEGSKAAARKLGSQKSSAKTEAAQINGKKGGRPRGT